MKRPFSKSASTSDEELVLLRNISAHFFRLWNWDFTITANAPKTKPAQLSAELVYGSRKRYNTLVVNQLTLPIKGTCWERRAPARPKAFAELGLSVPGMSNRQNNIGLRLVILANLLDVIAGRHPSRNRLQQLIEKHEIQVLDMDFPGDCLQRSIWLGLSA